MRCRQQLVHRGSFRWASGTVALLVVFLAVGSAVHAARADGFHIDLATGGLLDANGEDFVIRGVNNMVADYDNYNRNWWANDNNVPDAASPTGYFAADSILYIARKDFNMVRLQWRMQAVSGDLPVERLKTAIENAVDNNMVPMVQLHDGTDTDDTVMLQGMAEYWRDFWLALTPAERDAYKRYLIINIANEWGTWDMDLDDDGDHDAADRAEWASQYMTVIDTIRSGGYEGVLVIDGHGAGQRPEAIQEQGLALLSYDPAQNIMFSLHVYEDFQSHYVLDDVLAAMTGSALPIVIGEFGPRGGADEVAVMASADSYGVGYIGWAWQGDGTSPYGCCNTTLNVVLMIDDIPGTGGNEVCECFIDFRDWKGEDADGNPLLTGWGDILINHPLYGVVATSRIASIFPEIFHDGFESGNTADWSVSVP